MKPYQDHDPIKDRSKAVPHPKQPTHSSPRHKQDSRVVARGVKGRKLHTPEKAKALKIAARHNPIRHTPSRSRESKNI